MWGSTWPRRGTAPFFGTATGKTLFRRLVFENNREGFERLLVQAEAMRVQHGLKKVVFGLEPTATYHKALGEYLIRCGHRVVLVSTKSVKGNRESLDGRWDKHDTKDSANVADLISQGKCLYYEYPELKLRELRSLLSLKRRLKRQEHCLKVRIRNHLIAQYYPAEVRGRWFLQCIIHSPSAPSARASARFNSGDIILISQQ